MRGLVAVLLFACFVALTSGCTYTTTSSYRCGLWGWSRCRRTNYHTCKDGGYSAWVPSGSYSECSVTCGGGTKTRTEKRFCNNPTPTYRYGKSCRTLGPNTRTVEEPCNTHHCPVNGGWTDWDDWEDVSKCTVMCGGGRLNQTRARTCDNPTPMYGGTACSGSDTERQEIDCQTADCRADQCPAGNDTYMEDSEDAQYYYHCMHGDHSTKTRALLLKCPSGLEWDQSIKSCISTATEAPSVCKNGDYMRDPDNCGEYAQCSNGDWIHMSCSGGLQFNMAGKYCDYASNVQC